MAWLAGFTLADWVGVVGSLTICSAYGLVSWGRIDPERLPYQVANATGAILLLISLYYRPNPGAILIEAIWLLIAGSAILRILRRRL